ncbi:MAG: PspA/IM30 family protein [Acidobacteriia bacterium]|nr:PspA/IM30 family protein [Terriglobia bacterium]
MALLERVTTLIRANLNDLIDKAEDPEKMIKQVILDMQNQLIQVKTQVAVSIADFHLLEKKQKENEEKTRDWMKKAELAVDKKNDDLARAALERYKSFEGLGESFKQQVEHQREQVENLKDMFHRLEQKLAEAESKKDVLLARHRRARAASKASDAHAAIGDKSKLATFDRMKDKVAMGEAISQAKAELLADNLDDQLARLERDHEIENLLQEIKARRVQDKA